MKFYIVTCDASRHILPATMHLLKKYGPFPYDTFTDGPGGYKLIDLGKNDINRWTLDIYDQLKNETDEYIIFSLDDYLPIDRWNTDLNSVVNLYCKGYSRYELGYGAQLNNSNHKWGNSVLILRYPSEGKYRVSCQTSIWKTEILLNLLIEKARTPWDFEVKADIPGWVICTTDLYAFRWIEESALSKRHPGKINILGLRPADVEEMISLGLLDPARLQYGMRKDANPAYVPGRPIPIDPGPKYRRFYE